MSAERQVRLRNLAAYGLGDLFGSGSFVLLSLLYIYFLVEVIGLAPALATLVVTVGKVWDAFFDPLMGHLSDATRSRFGRRRIFFLIGIIPIAVSFSLLFLPVRFASDWATLVYYIFAYMLFCSVFTMVIVPYSALNAEMSRDYRVRTRLTAARLLGGGAATLLVGVVPRWIVESFADPRQGHLVMGVGFGVLFALPWLGVFLGTFELPLPKDPKNPKERSRTAVRDYFRSLRTLLQNRSFRLHMGMYIGAYSALDVVMAVALFYMTSFFARPWLFKYCLGVMMAGQLLSLFGTVALANRWGKGPAYVLGCSVWAAVMLAWLFVPGDAPDGLILAMFGLAGLGMSAGVMVPWAILPSVTDVDELITTEQRAGVYAGAMALVRKLLQGTVIGGVGLLLEAIGYVRSASQTAATLEGMRLIMALVPAAFLFLGIGFGLRFKITPRTHAILAQEIVRLRAGGERSEVGEETRAVCEALTGLPYDRLFVERGTP